MVSHTFNYTVILSRNIERHQLHVPTVHRLHTSPGQTNGCSSKLMFKHFTLQLDLEEQNEMNLPLWTKYLDTLVPCSYIIQRDRCHYRLGMADTTH
jgi:hypothetical protein